MQMAITQTTYCDFVVWSPSGVYHMEQIVVIMISLKKTIMPELLEKWYTRKHTEFPRLTLQTNGRGGR